MSASERDGRACGARPPRRKALLAGLIVAAGVLLVMLANAHLVYVAVSSQPECVTHEKSGGRPSGTGAFSAAKSAC
jgi:hypothetical protein